jgi:multiple sugar transport system permease protein
MRRAAVAFAVIAVITFLVGPFLWQVLTSLRPEAELTSTGLPRALSTESWSDVLGRPLVLRALGNSLLVAGATTVISIAIASAAAFAVARLPLPGKRALLALTLSVSMFPPIATVSPLYLIIRALGLLDSPAGLILPYTTFSLPLAIWILSGFFRDLPEELYRAAVVDGCTPWQAFTRIYLPLAAPAVATTAILVFVFAWNELLYALTFLSTPERRTVPVAIAMFAGEHKEPWGEIAAASVLATLPLVVATLAFQRRIVAGLTAGAVKG